MKQSFALFAFSAAKPRFIFRLRPSLPDPEHEFLLELAVAGRAAALVMRSFVSVLLADRLASREFIDSRAKLFNRADFDRALSHVPDVEPEEHDGL